jgi:NAD(P)-dependent dehydrogenase (short-subunit alcohol dehydrogenase family)
METSSINLIKERAALIAPALRMLLKQDSVPIVSYYYSTDIVTALESRESFQDLSQLFAEYRVDQQKGVLFIDDLADVESLYEKLREAIDNYGKLTGCLPVFVAVQHIGIFAVAQTKCGADAIIRDFVDAVKTSKPLIVPGNPEYFRQPNHVQRRVESKITVITGSAQGFGKGIALHMAEEGAYTIIADINESLANECANEICSLNGTGKALAVRVDVTQEDSIKNLMIETVLAFGGIDIFISNAGILKAGSLEEMDLKTFELVTKINYTAYFTGVKYASFYMKIQNRFDRNYYSDIIQINSKSGLEGSNKNFAYSGGKFGGIGLTQSFALELVGYNIKVNSICPGNFFEGPLWSDPENGLFAQYLRTNKVPGATTIEDVKRFYEGKVPMKRGCSVRDVTRAVFYLIEQIYETGQAVPVTGGQVMLN